MAHIRWEAGGCFMDALALIFAVLLLSLMLGYG